MWSAYHRFELHLNPPLGGTALGIRVHEVPFQRMIEFPTANALVEEIAVTLFSLSQFDVVAATLHELPFHFSISAPPVRSPVIASTCSYSPTAQSWEVPGTLATP
jgi:hypothetical protein